MHSHSDTIVGKEVKLKHVKYRKTGQEKLVRLYKEVVSGSCKAVYTLWRHARTKAGYHPSTLDLCIEVIACGARGSQRMKGLKVR